MSATRRFRPSLARPLAPVSEHEAGRSRRILGVRVDASSYAATTEQIVEWARLGESRYVCVSTVHMVMEAHDDPSFRAIVNGADLVTSDGMPLVWGLRLLGLPAERVYGPDLTPIVCERAAIAGVPIGFYGSTPEVLDRMIARLTERFPGLRVAYRCSPPFRPLTDEEAAHEIDAIRESGARVIFVGLGCPKQERWMAARTSEVPAVLIGVGAAFDFVAGTKRKAPEAVQRLGLEWLFRLVSEPRRLWRRYLYHNPRFVVLFATQVIRERFEGGRSR